MTQIMMKNYVVKYDKDRFYDLVAFAHAGKEFSLFIPVNWIGRWLYFMHVTKNEKNVNEEMLIYRLCFEGSLGSAFKEKYETTRLYFRFRKNGYSAFDIMPTTISSVKPIRLNHFTCLGCGEWETLLYFGNQLESINQKTINFLKIPNR